LIFTVLVNASPSQQGSLTAYHFSKAVLRKKHRILRIFFYRDGVLNANAFNSPPSDEFNITRAWQELATEHGIELTVCVAAAIRRGVLDEHELKSNDIASLDVIPANAGIQRISNLAPGFKITGLGQLIDGIINCDRFITFN
jgi:tRNA 2-thiouridine synthesizing protein D